MARILVVDDDPHHLESTAELIRRLGYTTVCAPNGLVALAVLRTEPVSAVVLDLAMPDVDGLTVLETMRRDGLTLPVIVQTTAGSLDVATTAMRLGACDFLVKPAVTERLQVALRNGLQLHGLQTFARYERHRRSGTLGLRDIVVASPAMERVTGLVRKAARSAMPVLLEGERGVGKALIGRVLHGASERAGKPLVAVNCAEIAAKSIDSVLFGHTAGAFSGAVADRPGRCSDAHGGTLYLEAIGDLPLPTQEKLLELIVEGTLTPVGSDTRERVNVRVIAATDCRLLNLTKAGQFREDLFYRLNVFPIYVPPLRERREEIAALSSQFITRLAAEAGRPASGLSGTALSMLQAHDWPGNVAELENLLYRAVILAQGEVIEPFDLPQLLHHHAGRDAVVRSLAEARPAAAPLHIDHVIAQRRSDSVSATLPDRFLSPTGDIAPLSRLERDLIVFALERFDGHMSQVARALGIGRSTLYRKLKEYGLNYATESDAA